MRGDKANKSSGLKKLFSKLIKRRPAGSRQHGELTTDDEQAAEKRACDVGCDDHSPSTSGAGNVPRAGYNRNANVSTGGAKDVKHLREERSPTCTQHRPSTEGQQEVLDPLPKAKSVDSIRQQQRRNSNSEQERLERVQSFLDHISLDRQVPSDSNSAQRQKVKDTLSAEKTAKGVVTKDAKYGSPQSKVVPKRVQGKVQSKASLVPVEKKNASLSPTTDTSMTHHNKNQTDVIPKTCPDTHVGTSHQKAKLPIVQNQNGDPVSSKSKETVQVSATESVTKNTTQKDDTNGSSTEHNLASTSGAGSIQKKPSLVLLHRQKQEEPSFTNSSKPESALTHDVSASPPMLSARRPLGLDIVRPTPITGIPTFQSPNSAPNQASLMATASGSSSLELFPKCSCQPRVRSGLPDALSRSSSVDSAMSSVTLRADSGGFISPLSYPTPIVPSTHQRTTISPESIMTDVLLGECELSSSATSRNFRELQNPELQYASGAVDRLTSELGKPVALVPPSIRMTDSLPRRRRSQPSVSRTNQTSSGLVSASATLTVTSSPSLIASSATQLSTTVTHTTVNSTIPSLSLSHSPVEPTSSVVAVPQELLDFHQLQQCQLHQQQQIEQELLNLEQRREIAIFQDHQAGTASGSTSNHRNSTSVEDQRPPPPHRTGAGTTSSSELNNLRRSRRRSERSLEEVPPTMISTHSSHHRAFNILHPTASSTGGQFRRTRSAPFRIRPNAAASFPQSASSYLHSGQSLQAAGTSAAIPPSSGAEDESASDELSRLKSQLIGVPGVLIVHRHAGRLIIFLSRDRPNVPEVINFMTSHNVPPDQYECQVLPWRYRVDRLPACSKSNALIVET